MEVLVISITMAMRCSVSMVVICGVFVGSLICGVFDGSLISGAGTVSFTCLCLGVSS